MPECLRAEAVAVRDDLECFFEPYGGGMRIAEFDRNATA